MTFLDVLLRVFAACALGAVIGFEREMKHRPAGLRTNMLTSLAACVFTVVTIRLAQDFIHTGGRIRGLTTGRLWLAAAAGLAFGAGYFGIAAVATLAAFLILFGLGLLEAQTCSQYGAIRQPAERRPLRVGGGALWLR